MQATVAKPKPKPKPAAAKGDASEAKARSSAPAKEAASAEAQRRATGVAAPSGERHQNEGHGRRLTMACEALEAFPALAESRDRLLSVSSKDHVATADVVSAVESDVALITAILRPANQVQDGRGSVDTIVGAVELLSPQTVQALADRVRTFDFFERSSVWEAAPERFRLHALATQHAADRLAAEISYEHRDRLTATSFLHDIGKLVLLHAYPGYPGQVHRGAKTPEDRIHQERRAEGKVYKQIAHELTLSTSTVRTHLHNIYGKLGAVDRAQAVLIATERGWL